MGGRREGAGALPGAFGVGILGRASGRGVEGEDAPFQNPRRHGYG